MDKIKIPKGKVKVNVPGYIPNPLETEHSFSVSPTDKRDTYEYKINLVDMVIADFQGRDHYDSGIFDDYYDAAFGNNKEAFIPEDCDFEKLEEMFWENVLPEGEVSKKVKEAITNIEFDPYYEDGSFDGYDYILTLELDCTEVFEKYNEYAETEEMEIE